VWRGKVTVQRDRVFVDLHDNSFSLFVFEYNFHSYRTIFIATLHGAQLSNRGKDKKSGMHYTDNSKSIRKIT